MNKKENKSEAVVPLYFFGPIELKTPKTFLASSSVCSDVCYVKCRKCGKKASKYERYVSPTGNGTSEIDSLLLLS
jgi:hypothetical protein